MEAIRKLSNFNFRWTKPCTSIISSIWHLFSHFSRAINRPLPSSKNPPFQNEARCTTFLVKMSFICMRMKNGFHIKGWAPTSFWNRGPGELGNGLLITPKKRSLWGPRKQTSKASNFTKWKNEILRMTILPVFSQFLWNLKYIFSGSHKKLSLVLLQITNYVYSPWKVWKRMGCDDSVLIAEDSYRQISFASSKRG